MRVLSFILNSNGLALTVRPLVAGLLEIDLEYRLCILYESRQAVVMLALLPRHIDRQDPPLFTAGEARSLEAQVACLPGGAGHRLYQVIWRLRGPFIIPAWDLVVVLEIVDVPIAGFHSRLSARRCLDTVLDSLKLHIMGCMRQGCDAAIELVERRRVG